ncbi:hypothetical protein HK102_007878 [Quaeritorhiza haematococci]|nr:hypothetical protein HK102_007878 [Quaeritorhiza haematococci]
MAVDPVQRLFLYSYFSHRIASEQAAKNLYRKACDKHGERYQEAEFITFINKVTRSIEPLHLSFRRSIDPESGITYWALVNLKGDAIAQLATEYTPAEINYLKRLINLIVNADDEAFELSSTIALREAGKVKPMISKKDAQVFLEKLVQKKWFDERNGLYSLALRSILELETYLKEEFGDLIMDCTICKDIATTHSERCEVAQCSARIHVSCSQRYFQQHQKKCPLCGSAWKFTSNTHRTRTRTSNRRRSSQEAENGDHENGDLIFDDDDDEDEHQQEEDGDEARQQSQEATEGQTQEAMEGVEEEDAGEDTQGPTRTSARDKGKQPLRDHNTRAAKRRR